MSFYPSHPTWGARSPLDGNPAPGWTNRQWDKHWATFYRNCVAENTAERPRTRWMQGQD